MLHQPDKHPLQVHGPQTEIAYVRFTPAASPAAQVLTEAQGIIGVTRNSAGNWTFTFAQKVKAIIPLDVSVVENDTTTYHFARCESTNAAAGTAVVTHKSVAYASVASGPTASDTVDEICAAFLLRMSP